LAEGLELDLVARAAAVEAEKERHRRAERAREQPRTQREARRRAEERAARGAFAAERAVAQQPHAFAAIEAFLYPQHALRPARRDDARLQLGREPRDERLHLARVVLVHEDAERPAGGAAERAEHLEAAEVRADQQAAAAARE